MEVRVTGKNLEVSPNVRAYLDKKLQRINRHFGDIMVLDVELNEEHVRDADKRFIVEINAEIKDGLIRAEERAGDLSSAIDLASATLDRRLEDYKGLRAARIRDRRTPGVRRPAPEAISQPAPEQAPAEGELPSRVVRVKRHAVKPMSVDEAIDQMELLGHDFFFFLNCDNEELNVVYKRRQGDYGLIGPAFPR